MKQFVGIGSVGVVVLFLARSTHAQTMEERAGARAAAEQGVKAFQEGRWADAADLMSRAEKILHAPTHLLYQAQAEEKLGHLVVAHELYLRVVREPLGRDAPAAFVSAQAEAKDRAEAVRARLSQISIVVEGTSSGEPVKVTVDDIPVPAALLGVPYPVDPGEHHFEATSGGRSSGRVLMTLREGTTEKVVLTIKAARSLTLAPNPTESQQPAASGHDGGASGASASGDPTSTTSTSGLPPLRLGGYVGLGLGVVGIGVGTVFALRSSSLRSDANALCNGPGGKCPEGARDKVEDLDGQANSAGTIALASFVGGGVGLAAGLTLLLLAPSTKEPAKAAVFTPYVAPNGFGVYGRY